MTVCVWVNFTGSEYNINVSLFYRQSEYIFVIQIHLGTLVGLVGQVISSEATNEVRLNRLFCIRLISMSACICSKTWLLYYSEHLLLEVLTTRWCKECLKSINQQTTLHISFQNITLLLPITPQHTTVA